MKKCCILFKPPKQHISPDKALKTRFYHPWKAATNPALKALEAALP